ncbi:MAG: NADH-quinone oxidoreductase subunit L [Anaerolineales bacterium]|nr:NADH-quinone oxidoreductase subunit L [Anaerolineales bacterium]
MKFAELQEIGKKELERQRAIPHRVFCCTSTACLSAGAGETFESLEQTLPEEIKDASQAEVVKTGCMGLCSRGPLIRVDSKDEGSKLYQNVTPEVTSSILAEHIPAFRSNGDDDSVAAEVDLEPYVLSTDIPFFTQQTLIVLEQTGQIDPESLKDNLAHGGYAALAHVLEKMTPEQICDEIEASGLRGRGGAGFPTGRKWHFVREASGERKFIVVNGDEGDPGAYMDRTVMEDDPHRVLEGMIIAAYAVGAQYGYFYVRGEYPIAVDRLRRAVRDARRRRILGKSVMGTNFAFDADVRIGAGAFVCGEETALIHSIEGKRGTPRMRPPYPSTYGLWGCPTVINNVETMANVPSIINHGAQWYADVGTESSKGSKVFALAGQLNNTGLIEVPMGITLREIVYEIGDGVPEGRTFKAAQTGGPSGGCIPDEFLDTPVDYESLTRLGSIMGSGGLVIIDDTTSMPEFARFFIDFCVDESCGKCVPCRAGTVQIRSLLDKIIQGDGSAEDIEKLESLCQFVKRASLCGLGQSAPNPVLSTLQYFRHEYEVLLQDTPSDGSDA